MRATFHSSHVDASVNIREWTWDRDYYTVAGVCLMVRWKWRGAMRLRTLVWERGHTGVEMARRQPLPRISALDLRRDHR